MYKQPTSRFWWVSVCVNGRRARFSTGTEDEDEARQIELTFRRRARGLPRDKFIALMDSLVGEASVSPTKSSFVSELPTTWMAFYAAENGTLSEKTRAARERLCARFAAWCTGKFGKSFLIDRVTPDVAWQFVSDVGGTAKTRQNVSGELSAVWGSLIRRGLVRENPWRYARPKGNAEERRTGRAFTPAEIRALLEETRSRPWLYTATLIALYTGLRQGDVIALTWDCVDLGQGVISLVPSKTKRHATKVVIPIHPALLAHLKSIPKDGETVAGVPNPHAITAVWKTCVQNAGINDDSGALLTFHSLRHTFATWVREAGADKGEQMLLGGWSEVSTANRYDHATTRLKEIVSHMPSV